MAYDVSMADLVYRKLSEPEIEAALADRPGWSRAGDGIERRFDFETYQEGLVFAAAVGYVADRLNHHPDLLVGYRKVTVSVTTHAVDGLSPYDFELAGRVDGLGVGG